MCTELGSHALTHHISAHSRLTVCSVHRTLWSQEYKRAQVLHSSGRTSAYSDSVHVSSRRCQTAPANYNGQCAQVLWFLLQRRRAGGSQPAGSLSSFVVLVPGPLAAAALQPEVLDCKWRTMLRACQSPGCHRVFPGRHRHCCTDCGNTGTQHSRRCQKLQRRLWRGYRGTRDTDWHLPIASMTVCTTANCGRLTGPGFDACCSRCGISLGRSHSRRCQGSVDAGFGAPWNAAMPVPTAPHTSSNAGLGSNSNAPRPALTIVSSGSDDAGTTGGEKSSHVASSASAALLQHRRDTGATQMTLAESAHVAFTTEQPGMMETSFAASSHHDLKPDNDVSGTTVSMQQSTAEQQCRTQPVLDFYEMD